MCKSLNNDHRLLRMLLFLVAMTAVALALPANTIMKRELPDGRRLDTTINIIEDADRATEGLTTADDNDDDDADDYLPSSLGTNFKAGEPFTFSHIYFLGGDCGNGDEGWYNKFVIAGLESLDGSEIVCPPNPEEHQWFTREFHLLALKEVEFLAGDKLNETLVITVGVNLEADWTPVAELMRKGMAFFHAKEDSIELRNFTLSHYGLRPEDILYLYFQWDEVSAAEKNGVELCRLEQGNRQLKIAKIYSGDRAVPLNYRVDLALESFKRECPQTEVIEVWQAYNNVSDDTLASILMFNPLPDIIMVDSDHIAGTILEIAEGVLTLEEYNQIATVGWDHVKEELLRDRRMLISVDQMVHHAGLGIWRAIQAVIDRAENSGLNSTKAIQLAMDRGDSMTMKADTLTVSGDQTGYLTSTLLTGYKREFPPSNDVRVSSGIFGVTITKMDPFDGYFEVVLWEKLAWRDPRLTWNPVIFDDEIPIDAELIWTPQLYYQNEFESDEIYKAPIMLSFNGLVVLQRNIRAKFLCSTTEDLGSFPFDSYDCAIDLGAPRGITLDQNFGFDIIDFDPHYNTEWFTDGEVGYIMGNTTTTSQVHYRIVFTHRPFTTYMRLILPAILINLIGFMAFWIPELPESVALGITALLCSLAFRETVEMPDTAEITWTEVFMMVNISYLASVMFITWCSYSSSTGLGERLNVLLKPCKPRYIKRMFRRNVDILKTSVSDRGSGHSDRSKVMDDLKKMQKELVKEETKHKQANPEQDITNRNTLINSQHARDQLESSPAPEHAPEGIIRRKSTKVCFDNSGTNWESYRSRENTPINSQQASDHSESSHAPEQIIRQKSRVSFVDSGTNWDSYRSRENTPINSQQASDHSESSHAPEQIIRQKSKVSFDDSGTNWDSYRSRENTDIPTPYNPEINKELKDEVEPQVEGRGVSLLGNRVDSMFVSRHTRLVQQRLGYEGEVFQGGQIKTANVDWIGRMFIVPSYIIVMATLVIHGWGFKK